MDFYDWKPSERGVATVMLTSGVMLLTKLKGVTLNVKLSDAPRWADDEPYEVWFMQNLTVYNRRVVL